MISDQYYYKPKPDDRTYELAVDKAMYLIDNGFVKLTSGLTEDQLIESLVINLMNKDLNQP